MIRLELFLVFIDRSQMKIIFDQFLRFYQSTQCSARKGHGKHVFLVVQTVDFRESRSRSIFHSDVSEFCLICDFRSYKNGFVWHDLSENDFIYPAHGQEYVLKGSELLEASASSGSQETSSLSSGKLLEMPKTEADPEFPSVRRRNLSWSALDINEYKVYKADPTVDISARAADASTQTDDKRRRRRAIREEEAEENEEECVNPTTELSRDEISPPESSPSPETLESLMRAEGRVTSATIHADGEISEAVDGSVGGNQSGRIKASTVLMQLISCGSISVREHGFSLMSHYRGRLPPRGGENQISKEMEGLMEEKGALGRLRLEEKEYFSGSFIETKKKGNDCVGEPQGLKRSSSYNADR